MFPSYSLIFRPLTGAACHLSSSLPSSQEGIWRFHFFHQGSVLYAPAPNPENGFGPISDGNGDPKLITPCDWPAPKPLTDRQTGSGQKTTSTQTTIINFRVRSPSLARFTVRCHRRPSGTMSLRVASGGDDKDYDVCGVSELQNLYNAKLQPGVTPKRADLRLPIQHHFDWTFHDRLPLLPALAQSAQSGCRLYALSKSAISIPRGGS